MKTIGSFFLILFFMSNLFAQAPQGISYQAVVRDNNGSVIPNQNVTFQLTIIQGSINGTAVYKEQHNTTTNTLGMVILTIGNGTPIQGTFNNINWQNAPYFVKVEVDVSGGANFDDMGTTQLLSVPYALFAEKAANAQTYTAGTGLTLTGTTFSHNPHSGDVSGTTALTVTGIQGRAVSTAAPTSNQVLQWNGTNWAPTNPTNLISAGSGLSYSGNTLNSLWTQVGNNIYNNNTGRVGIGLTSPTGKVTIKGDTSNVLFEILDKDGKQVFVIYQDSVHVFVNSTGTGNKGTFAVCSKSQNKTALKPYLRISPDSSRVYTEDPNKGFAVRNYNGGSAQSYMQLTPNNYFIGHEAGSNNTTGMFNSFIGYNAGKSNTTGLSNIFLGYMAGFSNTSGNKNIVIGNHSGYSSNGNYNILIGDSSGYMNSGYYNIFIGYLAGLNNISHNQTFVGTGAGYFNTNGTSNTYLGNSSGFYNNGSNNTFTGTVSGINVANGNNNTFIGSCSAGGVFSAAGNSNNNTFIGANSGYKIKNGLNNCLFGESSGYNLINGSGNIFIGYKAGYNETGSNKLFIENSDANHTRALIYGDFEKDTLRFNGRVGIKITPAYHLHIVANQASGIYTGLAHFVNTATNNDVAGIYASCKSSDYYGYGGYFEGGYTGAYGVVTPTGNSFYHGLYGAVIGGSGANYGVRGYAAGTGSNYGVYGSASGGTTNFAGYFLGNVHVQGTLSKSAGSFKIDHPLDPANKYLIHSFVESPDMKNIYDGIVVLNQNGEATVELPNYFETVNKDFRYQLTTIGGYAAVYIKSEIQNNKFVIAGGQPGMKVSWQVTGIRKDPYAVEYPIIPEVEKAAHEKGKYLNPELYNQPETKSIHYIPNDKKEEARIKHKTNNLD